MENNTQKKFIWGAVVGGVLAAATALFITPSSGTRIRQRMRNTLSRLQRKKVKRHSSSRRPSQRRHNHVLANSARKHKRAHSVR